VGTRGTRVEGGAGRTVVGSLRLVGIRKDCGRRGRDRDSGIESEIVSAFRIPTLSHRTRKGWGTLCPDRVGRSKAATGSIRRRFENTVSAFPIPTLSHRRRKGWETLCPDRVREIKGCHRPDPPTVRKHSCIGVPDSHPFAQNAKRMGHPLSRSG